MQATPKHPAANHFLGLLCVQLQQAEVDLPYLLTALEANPEEADYWLAYIDALLLDGQTDAAREVLTLGQQHGLDGKATEDLAIRLHENRLGEMPPKTSSLSTNPTKWQN